MRDAGGNDDTVARTGHARLAAVLGAAANGASIEALIFGETEGAATFDAAMTSLVRYGKTTVAEAD